MAEPVFSGFEGIVTPSVLRERRQAELAEQRQLRAATTQGTQRLASEAGAFTGQMLSQTLRQMFPQTFDGEGRQARKAQEIIDSAQRSVQDTEDDSPVGLINARLEAVKKARARARKEGMHDLADQLASNEIQLSAQALELRKQTAVVEAAEEPEGFKDLDQITEAVQRAEQAQAEGRLGEAELLRSKAAKDAGLGSQKVPEIVSTVRAMGLDPAAGEGFRLVRQSIEGAQKASQTDDQIAALRRRGFSQEKAEDIAYGFVRREVVPETGQVRLINDTTGDVFEVPIQRLEGIDTDGPGLGDPPRPRPERGQTLFDLAELATGPESALRAATAVPRAWFGFEPDERVIQARQAFRIETQSMVRSLAINPRFPVSEQERIRQEINIQPKVFDDPALQRAQMEQIHDSLELRMEQAFRDALDPSYPQEHREAQKQNAANIANFLAVLGVEQAREDRAAALGGAETEAEDVLPEGVPVGSRQIGTSNGNPVFEGPDGAYYEVEQ